jgi:hypothetical protein
MRRPTLSVGSMLTEDRSVIFRSICLFVGYVCLWMDAFVDAVCVRVCVQTTSALDWPLGSALGQPVVKGKRGFEPLPLLAVNRLCIHSIFNK